VNSQQLLYINIVIGLFFVLYFFFFRSKPRQPTRLNLRAQSEPIEKAKESMLSPPEPPRPGEPVLVVKAKDLRIFFVYNGHEWESHEVLGLQQDCTLQQATEMYQSLIKTSNPSTFEFYEAAFNSILKRKSGG
jgi:hypothetical protein